MNLKIILASKKITMREIADITGYSYGHVRNICCGTQASPSAHRRIEAALGMAPGSIWNDLESKPTETESSTSERKES